MQFVNFTVVAMSSITSFHQTQMSAMQKTNFEKKQKRFPIYIFEKKN